MAQLSKGRSPASWRITFELDKPHYLYLRKMSRHQADGIRNHIRNLVTARLDASAPVARTARWLDDVQEPLRGKLVKHGLIGGESKPDAVTVAELIERFEADPSWALKAPGTRRNLRQVHQNVIDCYGAETPIDSITPAAGTAFTAWLATPKPKGGGYKESTALSRGPRAKTLFTFAVGSRLIAENPLSGVKGGSRPTEDTALIGPEKYAEVMALLVGTETRLAFALNRYGGFRCPSELRPLRWADIDHKRGRLLNPSPKTGDRLVPIFPELVEPLAARRAEAAANDVLILPGFAALGESAYYNRVARALKKAGLPKWPRLSHNLRVSRQTELVNEGWPTFKVCQWLGNSPKQADAAYLKVSDDDFAKASAP